MHRSTGNRSLRQKTASVTYIVYLYIYIVQEMCSKFWPEEHDSPAVYPPLLVHRVGSTQEPDWDEIQLEVLGKHKVRIA